MAKGVAAMTMDEDYQQKRREAMNKQPAGLREGITRGGKGLVSVRFPWACKHMQEWLLSHNCMSKEKGTQVSLNYD